MGASGPCRSQGGAAPAPALARFLSVEGASPGSSGGLLRFRVCLGHIVFHSEANPLRLGDRASVLLLEPPARSLAVSNVTQTTDRLPQNNATKGSDLVR